MKLEKAKLRKMYEKFVSKFSIPDVAILSSLFLLTLFSSYLAIETQNTQKRIKAIEEQMEKIKVQKKEITSFNNWGFIDSLRAKGTVQIKLEDIDFDSDLDIVMYDSAGRIKTYENKMPIKLLPEKERVLSELVLKLKADGYDITPYLKDPRFRYYRDIKQLLYGGGEISEKQHKKNLEAYVKKYLEDATNFMILNEKSLNKAYQVYGIEPEYIVSILNKESLLGKGKGVRNVFSTLVSIYLDFPYSRHKRFNAYKQMNALLKLSNQENRDIYDYKGSFMAAMELPQSLPENVFIYGVDFDDDRKIDLADVDDAIGFIGNYLSKAGFGWSKRRAVYGYNHSESYCDYIEVLAKALRQETLKRKILWNRFMFSGYKFNSEISDKLRVSYSF